MNWHQRSYALLIEKCSILVMIRVHCARICFVCATPYCQASKAFAKFPPIHLCIARLLATTALSYTNVECILHTQRCLKSLVLSSLFKRASVNCEAETARKPIFLTLLFSCAHACVPNNASKTKQKPVYQIFDGRLEMFVHDAYGGLTAVMRYPFLHF